MKKSEKILLSLVAVAGLYGIVDFTLQATVSGIDSSKITPLSNQQLTAISTELNSISADENIFLASLTETIVKPWGTDVFLKKEPTTAQETVFVDSDTKKTDVVIEQIEKEVQNLSYSGFLTMANETIAIIDGLDYRVNDSVNGFFITSISPTIIELEKKGMTFTLQSKKETRSGLYSKISEKLKVERTESSSFLTPPPSTQ